MQSSSSWYNNLPWDAHKKNKKLSEQKIGASINFLAVFFKLCGNNKFVRVLKILNSEPSLHLLVFIVYCQQGLKLYEILRSLKYVVFTQNGPRISWNMILIANISYPFYQTKPWFSYSNLE